MKKTLILASTLILFAGISLVAKADEVGNLIVPMGEDAKNYVSPKEMRQEQLKDFQQNCLKQKVEQGDAKLRENISFNDTDDEKFKEITLEDELDFLQQQIDKLKEE